MNNALRRAVFAAPFGCLVALLVHIARFGDDHAFGGESNEGLVAAAVGGSVAIALTIVHLFLSDGTTTSTGTLAAARARTLLPGAPVLFGCAAAIYYGIESLEGNGIELGVPTLLLGLLAIVVASALRGIVGLVADIVADLKRDWLARLTQREPVVWRRALQARPIGAQEPARTRRFGRAPPNGRHGDS